MLAAAIAIPSSPPSSLLPTFGPGRAGQVVPRLDLSHLLGEAGTGPISSRLSLPGGDATPAAPSAPAPGVSRLVCALGIAAGLGVGVLGGILIGRRG